MGCEYGETYRCLLVGGPDHGKIDEFSGPPPQRISSSDYIHDSAYYLKCRLAEDELLVIYVIEGMHEKDIEKSINSLPDEVLNSFFPD